MFDYTICNYADRVLFEKQCRAIEQNIIPLQKDNLLEDVDGTLVQKYQHQKGSIVVKNDRQVDALYVQSDFDLRPYFQQN